MDKNRSGRRYDAEFKESAVALVESGRKISHVARDLGVGIWTVSCWVRAKQKGQKLSEPKTRAAQTAAERENRRLRQDNEYLRRQRDILKKALAIVSDGNLPGASNS